VQTGPLPADERADRPPTTRSSSARSVPFKTIWAAQEGTAAGGVFAFVVAGYGDARVALDLARGFRQERTVYVLQPPDAGGVDHSLRAVIDEYAASLQRCQPSGPYHLGGYSAGGLIALEIGRRLMEAGERVELLAIFDPLFADYGDLAVFGYRAMKRGIDALNPAITRRSRLLRILTAMVRDEALAFHLRALQGHRPAPYPGTIHLFWTRTPFPLRPPRALSRWRAIGGDGLIVHRAPGTHHSFMRPPHVHRLAGTLDAMMDGHRA
jgi:thioesterase domain-containing protein